jgi:PAS domain S-box-containing protein
MAEDDEQASQVQKLLDTPHLADALESEQFRHFLDQMPIALIVSSLEEGERIIYANPEFEKLSGQGAQDIEGKSWTALRGADAARDLGEAIESAADFIGTFRIERAPGEVVIADAYSNVIEDEDGAPAFRLAALVDVGAHQAIDRESLELRIREKDTQMRELQHRVKNNLQMITALIRLEAREALHLLYRALSDADVQEIDLGVYLSEIASAAMRAHATEGIRLNLKVDAYPVSLNVAMPAGLIVNELLTNALKHAFVGRDGGTITLHSLADEKGCRVVVADDGVGFPEGVTWPKRGKLGALIVQSLRENAKAGLEFETAPGKGSSVTMVFTRAAAAPERSGEMNSDERK